MVKFGSSELHEANPWESFDKIYCINLKERGDKHDYCKEVFKKMRVPVDFYRPDRHPNGGVQGCFESHISVIKKAYDQGCENVVIFEDDIFPQNVTSEKLEEIIKFIKEEDWDIFYLGGSPLFFSLPRKERNYKDVYALKYNCTHAYILNRKYMRELKDTKFNGTAIDIFYSGDSNRSYGIQPSLFQQAPFASDVSDQNRVVENFKDVVFNRHKPFWMNLVEYSSINKGEILGAISSALFLVLLLIFLARKREN